MLQLIKCDCKNCKKSEKYRDKLLELFKYCDKFKDKQADKIIEKLVNKLSKLKCLKYKSPLIGVHAECHCCHCHCCCHKLDLPEIKFETNTTGTWWGDISPQVLKRSWHKFI